MKPTPKPNYKIQLASVVCGMREVKRKIDALKSSIYWGVSDDGTIWILDGYEERNLKEKELWHEFHRLMREAEELRDQIKAEEERNE